jgi:hypothetical protein
MPPTMEMSTEIHRKYRILLADICGYIGMVPRLALTANGVINFTYAA